MAQTASVSTVRAPAPRAVLVIPEAKVSHTPPPEVGYIPSSCRAMWGQMVRTRPRHGAQREEHALESGPELLGKPAVQDKVTGGAHSQQGVAHQLEVAESWRSDQHRVVHRVVVHRGHHDAAGRRP